CLNGIHPYLGHPTPSPTRGDGTPKRTTSGILPPPRRGRDGEGVGPHESRFNGARCVYDPRERCRRADAADAVRDRRRIPPGAWLWRYGARALTVDPRAGSLRIRACRSDAAGLRLRASARRHEHGLADPMGAADPPHGGYGG